MQKNQSAQVKVKMTTEEEASGDLLGLGDDQEIDQCSRDADEVRQSILSSSGSNKLERGHRELDLVMVRLAHQFRSILISLPSISGADDSSTDSSFSSERTSFRISFSEACTSLLPVGQADDTVAAPLENLHQFQIGYSGIITNLTPRPEAINYLQRIAEQMVSSGYSKECVQAYGIVREAAVETNVSRLGFERMTLGDIQMLESDGLDKKVRKWIAVATMCARELFVTEKRLFEQVFEGSSLSAATKYICFIDTVKAPTMQLLSFPQAVSSSRRFPEKLFSILDLYNALSDLLPEIEQIFKPGGWELIRAEAEWTMSKLADAAGLTLLEFENALLREITVAVNPGGGIHSIARYVMKYMKSMLAFKQDLSKIVIPEPASLELVISGDLVKHYLGVGGKSGLALHFNWIATVLQFKLEEKSKLYEDPSLAHLFMMNNLFYMHKNIGDSAELKEMIGRDYFKRLSFKFLQAAMNYRRSTWLKVLNCLRTEGLKGNLGVSSGVSKSVLRRRLKAFVAMFEEIRRTQATWLVPDIHLREELLISISEKLVMAYRLFLKRFRIYMESARHPEKYIKYSAEDLEAAVLNLFEGRTTS